jgi:predicted nucleic acid-binding protein
VSALYLDSSAFVKVIIEEPGSRALRRFLAGSRARRVSSAIVRTEAMRAVRHLSPDALATVREGLRRIDIVGVDDRILDAAGILEPRIVRTLDAIHLATALAIGDDLDAVVTYDDRMADAAGLLGLRVARPS